MDYENYYQLQARNKLPVFSGNSFQRGYGIGSVFSRFFKWIVPIIKSNAMPIAKKIGKKAAESAVKTAVNIATDTIDGKDVKASAKRRIEESINKVFSGSGYKRTWKKRKKLIPKRNNKKIKQDIFE